MFTAKALCLGDLAELFLTDHSFAFDEWPYIVMLIR